MAPDGTHSVGTGVTEPAARWPEPLNDTADVPKNEVFAAKAEIVKAREEAAIARDAAEQAAVIARAAAEHQADLENNAAYYAAITEVATSTLERSRQGAETVLKASAAIVGLYTAALGLVFAHDGTPLPVRGLAPVILLGASVVFATFYVAYIGRFNAAEVAAPRAHSLAKVRQQRRARTLIEWTREGTLRRSYWIRASVIALGFGLMLLPVPFIAVGEVELPGLNLRFGSEPRPPAAHDWPTEGGLPKNQALAAILYTKQVEEAATLRAKEKPAGNAGADDMWMIVTGLLIIASLLLAFIGSGTKGEKKKSSGASGSLPAPQAATDA